MSIAAGYFDCRQVLAEEQDVPTQWLQGGHDLGYALNPRAGIDSVQPEDRVELPCWLAQALRQEESLRGDGQYGLVRLQRPKLFSEKLNRALQADARCVRLSAQSDKFYELARQLALADVPGRQGSISMDKLLLETFQRRYKDLLMPAGCWSEEAWGRVKDRLTAEERALVMESREAYARFRQWRQRQGKVLLTAAPVVSNKRKRVHTGGFAGAHRPRAVPA